MSELNIYRQLCDMIESLEKVDLSVTNKVANIRNLIRQINDVKDQVLSGEVELTEEEVAEYQAVVDSAVAGKMVNLVTNVETEHSIQMFQLGASADNVSMKIIPNSTIPPEHGSIVQKLWKIRFKDGTTGHAIFSDTSDEDLCAVVNAQVSTALATAPDGALEDLDVTISLNNLEQLASSQDFSSVFNVEKPAIIARQLRDIDIDTDPELAVLTPELKNLLKSAVNVLNTATTEEEKTAAEAALLATANQIGLYSIALGPRGNSEYSDLKRFRLEKEGGTVVTVVASMPVISWGDLIAGIPLRDPNGPKDKTNRKDDGTSYVVDLGGFDPVIRKERPNPLPPTRYHNYGPNLATETEGALDRYVGGKCLGINTTNTAASFQSLLYEEDGVVTVTVPPLTALWKLDRATFDGGNNHAYYTVFSASRGAASGFMGVVFAPKQGRLGRGRGEIASGVTLANGVSQTGKTFNQQDSNGAILDNSGNEVPSGLKGVTSASDGHGMHPKDLLTFLEANNFVKGEQYLTIPADATVGTVEDVLIPAGQFIPQITQAIGTLFQFTNGVDIPSGGPARFQPGLIPFLPGTLAYTPEWHINWIAYNCGRVDCDGETYQIDDPAKDTSPESWIRPAHNPSFGPPGPNPANSSESGYSPAFPDTFDPVQLRCRIKWTKCDDYVNKIEGAVNGEITLSMLSKLESENKIFITEAPAGALRGWVKYLVVNCPLPFILNIKVVGEEEIIVTNPVPSEDNCASCTCSRTATSISINGDLNPIWLDEDDQGEDTVIGDRVLKFKVGDNVVIRSTSGTMHGVSLRVDGITTNTEFDPNKTLEVIQDEVLVEIENTLTINNKQDLENNIIALVGDVVEFHGGVPITFAQKATVNPASFPDGVVISDFTVKEGAEGSSGTVSCTVHGIAMSFKFTVCES